MAFPVGYSWSFGERIQEQDRQLEQMIVNYLLALALIYIVMASQFESLVHPFAILFSIPFAFWGVTWFLLVTHTPLNFIAQIDLLVLMGIVVKNGIVLIDHINNLRREGYDRETAIELGGKERLRPILMTAATAVLALVPMAIGRTGLTGLYYFPLARTVIGGLTASTFLTSSSCRTSTCSSTTSLSGLAKCGAKRSGKTMAPPWYRPRVVLEGLKS